MSEVWVLIIVLQCEIGTNSVFSEGDKYNHAYWNLRTLYLKVRERL